MQVIVCGGRKYLPTLTKDGKLDLRASVAYGTKGSGRFMLTVYALCQYRGAGSRGGKNIQHFDIPVMREHVHNTTSEKEQTQRLEFMLNILAVQQDCDYRLRLPIAPKATPKGKITRRT